METPSAAKWNILGSNDASLRDGTGILINNNQPIQGNNASSVAKTLVKKNASNQTLIGENEVRPTRFVALNPPVLVVSAADPADTAFVNVDVTTETSARAYSVTGVASATSATAGHQLHMRADDDATALDNLNLKIRITVSNIPQWGSFNVGLDAATQIFEYAASNAGVSAVNIIINGYWEYVD